MKKLLVSLFLVGIMATTSFAFTNNGQLGLSINSNYGATVGWFSNAMDVELGLYNDVGTDPIGTKTYLTAWGLSANLKTALSSNLDFTYGLSWLTTNGDNAGAHFSYCNTISGFLGLQYQIANIVLSGKYNLIEYSMYQYVGSTVASNDLQILGLGTLGITLLL